MAENEYLFNAKTSDGYYIEASMLVMSTTLGSSCTMIIGEDGFTLCGSTDKVKMEIAIQNLEYYYVDPCLVGMEFQVSSKEKNYVIANNKKKDYATFQILRESNETLRLLINDSIGITQLVIPYDLTSMETDIPTVRPDDKKLVNPNVVSDSGELTKNFKILMKSCKYAEIQSQPNGIKIVPEKNSLGGEPITMGKWNPNLPIDNKITVKTDVFKPSNKLLTLSKKIRLHCTKNGFYICIFMVNGLGKSVSQYMHTEPPIEEEFKPIEMQQPSKTNRKAKTNAK